MHPSQKIELEAQARKIIQACDEQLSAAQSRADQQGLSAYKMFTPDGKLITEQTVLAKSNALLTIAMLNQPKEK